MWGRVQPDSFACGYLVVPAQFIGKRNNNNCSFTIEWSWHPCQKSFYHRYMGVFLDCQSCSVNLCFYPYVSTTLFWEVFVFQLWFYHLQQCFGCSGSLAIPMTFRISFYHFDQDYTDSVDRFGSVVILTILNLPVREHKMTFCLFRLSLISFSNIL